MGDATRAWRLVQISECARAAEDHLLRALGLLSPDVRATMPEDSTWVLSGNDADELRTLLAEHAELAEQLQILGEQLPDEGVAAAYEDVRDGAASALADGILDPAAVAVTVSALDVRTGWVALADSLVSTDVRTAWTELTTHELLISFRAADHRLVGHLLEKVAVNPETYWSDLTTTATRRLAGTLRTYAEQA